MVLVVKTHSKDQIYQQEEVSWIFSNLKPCKRPMFSSNSVNKHMKALGSLKLMTTDHCGVTKTYFHGVPFAKSRRPVYIVLPLFARCHLERKHSNKTNDKLLSLIHLPKSMLIFLSEFLFIQIWSKIAFYIVFQYIYFSLWSEPVLSSQPLLSGHHAIPCK